VAYFKQIAMGEVSSSALEAKARGFLRQADIVLMNPYEILYVAIQQAHALAAAAYRPPLPAKIAAIGKPGIANLEMLCVNLLKGQFISDYDFNIALKIATILCGGKVEAGSVVDEEWYLRLEREYFMAGDIGE
jgi:3-hydroxyacyl-CoA dehydrogenase